MTTVPLESSDMLQKVMDFPDQVANAYLLTRNSQISTLKPSRKVSNVVILGMGGSGIAGDFARVLARNSIPIHICKNSVPPRFVNNETLVIAVTYSGKTRETLNALDVAASSDAMTIALTSSLELGSVCEKRNIPWIRIPSNSYPRVSTGYMLIPILAILQKIGVLDPIDSDISETVPILARIRNECGPDVPPESNPAYLLALALEKGFPIIFGEYDFTDVVALRWKQLLNENSKAHCYCDTFPELLHNEIEAWGSDNGSTRGNATLVLLRDAAYELETNLGPRIETAKEIIKNKGNAVFELWSTGNCELARLLSLSYLGDFVSIYLAKLKGVDPVDIHNIELVKKIGLANPEPKIV